MAPSMDRIARSGNETRPWLAALDAFALLAHAGTQPGRANERSPADLTA